MTKQDRILFQVQLLVEEGEATFNNENGPLPCGRRKVTKEDGWVPISPTFYGTPVEIENGDEECSETPIGRAKVAFREHQIQTLGRLENDMVRARLRIQSYCTDETLEETDSSRGVKIHARHPIHRL